MAVSEERLSKDTYSVKIYKNFTSLPTTYDYPPLQAQLTMSLLANLRDGSALAIKHPNLTGLTPFPVPCPITIPQTSYKLLAATKTHPSARNILPLLSELTIPLPARLSSNDPSSRKQIVFPNGHPQHSVMVPDVDMSLSQLHHGPMGGCRF